MSEKRFFTKINKNGRNVIIDKECHIEIIDLTLACEVLNRLDLKLKTYNEQISEQQATIRRLQDLCGESDGENAKLRLKNKKLQDKIDWLCEKYDYPNEKDKTKVVKMTNRTDEKELRKLLGLIDDE